MSASISNVRPKPDKFLVDNADSVSSYTICSTLHDTALNCLIDTRAGLEALSARRTSC
jgi:2-methylcitrate dehydratase